MASNITYVAIDETYPIAGRDNDSQGFRDNFSVIKNNFESAKSEIEDLQLNTARLDDSNDFNGNSVSNMTLRNYSDSYYSSTSVDSLIDFTTAPYQFFSIVDNASFTLYKFPDPTKCGKLRVEVKNSNPAIANRTVTFNVTEAHALRRSSLMTGASGLTIAANPVPTSSSVTIILPASEDSLVFEFWSHGGAGTIDATNKVIFMTFLGRFS